MFKIENLQNIDTVYKLYYKRKLSKKCFFKSNNKTRCWCILMPSLFALLRSIRINRR